MAWGNLLAFNAVGSDADLPGQTLTYSLAGTVRAGASIDSSTGAFSWTPSMAQIASHTFTVRVTDDGSPSLHAQEQITVTVIKRATALVYGGSSSVQYSDPAALSAELRDVTNGLPGTPLAGKQVTFTIGSQSKSAVTDGAGVAADTLIITQGPGTLTVVTTFAGDTGYLQSGDSDPFAITKEDARVEYTGMQYVSTPSTSSGLATVQLRTTVLDITAVPADPAHDAHAGDIRNASVRFVNRDNGDATPCVATVVLLSAADQKVATASCIWSANIGDADSISFTVGIVIDGHYTRDSSEDNEVITVSKPYNGFITGGGYLIAPCLAAPTPVHDSDAQQQYQPQAEHRAVCRQGQSDRCHG